MATRGGTIGTGRIGDDHGHKLVDVINGWEAFFGTLGDLRFDGFMTVCVFAWEDRAAESSLHNLSEILRRTASWPHLA